MKHFLTVIVPENKAVKYALKGDIITIGRAEDNVIALKVSAVSSQHLEIRKTNSGYRVTDLNSTNGTTVNGERISEHPLADGDELIIGAAIRAQYSAVADDSTAATAPAAALPPKTVAQPAQPPTPTVILKKAPALAPAAAAAASPSAPVDPPSEIRIRKMIPPGAEEAANPSPPPESESPQIPEAESEEQNPAPKLKVPNPGQPGAGPKKLNLG